MTTLKPAHDLWMYGRWNEIALRADLVGQSQMADRTYGAILVWPTVLDTIDDGRNNATMRSLSVYLNSM